MDETHRWVPQDHVPLRKAQLPVRGRFWHHVARPGGWRHIHLEEARALRWGLESRALHALELHTRFLHGCDNATAVCALAKGRSASHALNQECRRVMAVSVAMGSYGFYLWLGTDENPSDAPSSRYGIRAGALPPDGAILGPREWALVRRLQAAAAKEEAA